MKDSSTKLISSYYFSLISPSHLLYSSSHHHSITKIDLNSPSESKLFHLPNAHSKSISSISYHPTHNNLFLSSSQGDRMRYIYFYFYYLIICLDGHVKLWDDRISHHTSQSPSSSSEVDLHSSSTTNSSSSYLWCDISSNQIKKYPSIQANFHPTNIKFTHLSHNEFFSKIYYSFIFSSH